MAHDPTPAGSPSRAHNIKARAVDEFRRFVLLFLYLWVMLGLFTLNERVILQQEGINFVAQGFALVNALVLAKVMLVAEALRLNRWMAGYALIYRILADALLMAVLFIIFHVLEKVLVGLVHGATTAASVPAIGGGGIAGLLCVAIILFVALIPRFAFAHVSEALGPGEMRRILFSTGNPARL